jgi:CheY-like chemotaxis protein
LERLGYKVVTALEVFQANKDEINLVLLDLIMPRMNGWETMATLRKLIKR